MKREPTVWQLRWARWRRPVLVVLAVALVVAAVSGHFGVAAVLFAVLLGIGAFSSGTPRGNGPTSPPSVPGTYLGG